MLLPISLLCAVIDAFGAALHPEGNDDNDPPRGGLGSDDDDFSDALSRQGSMGASEDTAAAMTAVATANAATDMAAATASTSSPALAGGKVLSSISAGRHPHLQQQQRQRHQLGEAARGRPHSTLSTPPEVAAVVQQQADAAPKQRGAEPLLQRVMQALKVKQGQPEQATATMARQQHDSWTKQEPEDSKSHARLPGEGISRRIFPVDASHAFL